MKPTGTVTFLFADIVGTSFIGERRSPAGEAGTSCLGAVISDVIVRNHGIVYWSSGFRYCCAFVLPLDAVIAANQIQSRLGSAISNTDPAVFRMAVHTGEAQESEGHYSGATVNRVLQLLSMARPGEVLASSSVEKLVSDFLPEDLQFNELLHRELPNRDRILQLRKQLDAPAVEVPLRATRYAEAQSRFKVAYRQPRPRVSYVRRRASRAPAIAVLS